MVERSFRSLQGQGTAFTSQSTARKVNGVVEGLKAKGSAVTEDEWVKAWQEVLSITGGQFNHERVIADLDGALAGSE